MGSFNVARGIVRHALRVSEGARDLGSGQLVKEVATHAGGMSAAAPGGSSRLRTGGSCDKTAVPNHERQLRISDIH